MSSPQALEPARQGNLIDTNLEIVRFPCQTLYNYLIMWLWPNVMTYPIICLQALRHTKRSVRMDGLRSPVSDFNPGLSEYKVGALPTHRSRTPSKQQILSVGHEELLHLILPMPTLSTVYFFCRVLKAYVLSKYYSAVTESTYSGHLIP
jgi:hypothetical protein